MQQIFGAGLFTHFILGPTFASSLFICNVLCKILSFSTSEESAFGMQLYADLFKENHITGKRLLLLTENDMRDMGVKSKGHAMHLKASRS